MRDGINKVRRYDFFRPMTLQRTRSHFGVALATLASLSAPALAAPLTGTGGSTSNPAVTGGTVVDFNALSNNTAGPFTLNGVTFSPISPAFGGQNAGFAISNSVGGVLNVPAGQSAIRTNPGGSGFGFTFLQPVSAFAFNVGDLGSSNTVWALKSKNAQGQVL